MKLSPADYVIKTVGGVCKLASALGVTNSAISNWRRSKIRRGTGGFIPRIAQQKILAIAKKRGLDITANDLIHGR